MKIKEQIAYLKGLLEGADFFGQDVKSKVIWENLLQICSGLADQVEFLEQKNSELEEFIEAVDLDLADVEDIIFDTDDDLELVCPVCGEEIYVDDLENGCFCPECGESLHLDDEEEYELNEYNEDLQEDAEKNNPF